MAKKKNSAAVSLGRNGGKKRWEGKTKEQRSEHMKMMRKHRRSYPQFRKKSIDPTNS